MGVLYSVAVDVGCYACGEPTRRRCRDCRQPYCSQHGEVICDACRGQAEAAARRLPVSFLYSPLLFRVALGLVVGGLLLGVVPDVWARIAPPPAAPGASSAPKPAPAPAKPVTTPPPASSPLVAVSPTAPAASPAVTTTATVTATGTPSGPIVIRYTVAEGDDLRGIAQRFDVSTQAIISYNSLAEPANLRPGQVLLIPK